MNKLVINVQGQDRTMFCCSICSNYNEKCFNCKECEACLCVDCFLKIGHIHPVFLTGFNMNAAESESSQVPQEEPSEDRQVQEQEQRQMKYRKLNLTSNKIYLRRTMTHYEEKAYRHIQHMVNCKNKPFCNEENCNRSLKLANHAKICKNRSKCSLCRMFYGPLLIHANNCSSSDCPDPFCTKMKKDKEKAIFVTESPKLQLQSSAE